MRSKRSVQSLLILITALFILGALFAFRQKEPPLFSAKHYFNFLSQNTNTYLGPSQRLTGDPQLIRLQVLIYNDPNPKGAKIVNAKFNGTSIPLKPRDIFGYRGQASFQKPPGKYKLSWEVERDKTIWPRIIDHEEEVFLSDKDYWIQITITGEQAEIS